jgi:hypothetical protein
MASSSSSSTPSLGHLVSEKLTRENFTLWKAQVIPAIKGAQLYGYVDGTIKAPPAEIDREEANSNVSNPAYATWMAQDQSLLSYINASVRNQVISSLI